MSVAASASGLVCSYQYNWKRDKSQIACKLVTPAFRDGSRLEAKFQLR